MEVNIKEKKILEIGSGAGQFIKKLTGEGIDAVGIEPGKQSFDYCKSEKLNIINTSIEEFEPSIRFDIVSSFHVIEHVKSPKAFLKKCYDLLYTDGLIYLEVPNLHKPGKPYADFFQFPHLYSFSYITLSNYLRMTGFETVYIRDEVYRLTIIAKKKGSENNNQYIRVDPLYLVKRANFVDKVQRIANQIPNLPFLKKLKAILIQISI